MQKEQLFSLALADKSQDRGCLHCQYQKEKHQQEKGEQESKEQRQLVEEEIEAVLNLYSNKRLSCFDSNFPLAHSYILFEVAVYCGSVL